MASRMKSVESPEINPAVVSLCAKRYGFLHQLIAKTTALHLLRDDEPPKVRTIRRDPDPIDRNTPFNPIVEADGPKAVTRLVKSTEKLRKVHGNLGFKEESEAPISVIIRCMELGNSADRTRYVPDGDRLALHDPLFLTLSPLTNKS
jgi:hypothetical protein